MHHSNNSTYAVSKGVIDARMGRLWGPCNAFYNMFMFPQFSFAFGSGHNPNTYSLQKKKKKIHSYPDKETAL